MRRREFLRAGAAALALPALGCAGGARRGAGAEEGVVMTVRGPIAPEAMGVALTHEHLASTVGMPITPRADHRYGPALERMLLPQLRWLRQAGCDTLVDAGPAYIGRSPLELRSLSERSGVHLVTTTGYYGAAGDRYLPPHAHRETPGRLAERWVEEWTHGIGDTGVRPGLIKIGVDPGALSDVDARLVRAAALAHRQTGLAIASHTGGSVEAARAQLAILREEGVAPDAWVWVHAQGVERTADLAEAAAAGAWISLDGVQADAVPRYVERVAELRDAGQLRRVLLSHDAVVFRPDGRPPRHFHALFTGLLPALRQRGFGEGEIRRLLVDNPRDALTVRRRL